MRRSRQRRRGWALVWSCMAWLPGCGCGSEAVRPDGDGGSAVDAAGEDTPCEDSEGAYFRWVIDGQAGETCAEVSLHSTTFSVEPLRGPAEEISYAAGRCAGAGAFIAHLSLYNIAPADGVSGELVEEEGRTTRRYPSHLTTGRTPYSELRLQVGATGLGCGGERDGFATSGSWRVVRGGTYGDEIVVEARDVVIAPIEGHSYRFDRVHLRSTLLGPTSQEPSDPLDAGAR